MGESIGQKGKGGRKGRNDWRDKEEGRGLRSYESERRRYSADFRLYPRLFYGDPWEGGKVGVVDFLARKASGSRNYRETSRGAPLFYRESRDLWSGRCAPTPSFLLILAARRWFIGSTGSWLGVGTFLSSMNRDMLDCFRRFRWYVFGISIDCERDREKKLRKEICCVSWYDKSYRSRSFTLLIDKNEIETLCYIYLIIKRLLIRYFWQILSS